MSLNQTSGSSKSYCCDGSQEQTDILAGSWGDRRAGKTSAKGMKWNKESLKEISAGIGRVCPTRALPGQALGSAKAFVPKLLLRTGGI